MARESGQRVSDPLAKPTKPFALQSLAPSKFRIRRNPLAW